MIKKIDHGIQWNDMEVTCLCEDPQGRLFMRVKRGATQTDFYVTKGGSLKIQESKKSRGRLRDEHGQFSKASK